jgi:hypothetical protein
MVTKAEGKLYLGRGKYRGKLKIRNGGRAVDVFG